MLKLSKYDQDIIVTCTQVLYTVSFSISLILEHEFFCFCHLGSQCSHENFFNFCFCELSKISSWQKKTYLWLDLSKYLSCREVLTKMGCFPAGWTIVSIRECPLIKFKWLSDNSLDFPLQRPGLGVGTSRTGNQL